MKLPKEVSTEARATRFAVGVQATCNLRRFWCSFYSCFLRANFLVDQNRVLTLPDPAHRTRDKQIELISRELLADESDADLGNDVRGDDDDLPGTVATKHFGTQNKSANKELAKESASASARHKLFAKRDRQLAQARTDARKETAAR
ncbi:hypothetical protein M0805_003234 [Coniferiporia weirii]|nr:hypothetical protein M0805_003234 [Coniferiporia weirii]